jgi:hypothetical protein
VKTAPRRPHPPPIDVRTDRRVAPVSGRPIGVRRLLPPPVWTRQWTKSPPRSGRRFAQSDLDARNLLVSNIFRMAVDRPEHLLERGAVIGRDVPFVVTYVTLHQPARRRSLAPVKHATGGAGWSEMPRPFPFPRSRPKGSGGTERSAVQVSRWLSSTGSTCAGRPGRWARIVGGLSGLQWTIEAQMRRTPSWTVVCLPVDGALSEPIVGILIRAQSTRREAGVKHRTVIDFRSPNRCRDSRHCSERRRFPHPFQRQNWQPIRRRKHRGEERGRRW